MGISDKGDSSFRGLTGTMEALQEIFSRSIKTSQLYGAPSLFTSTVNARERAVEAYAKRLFLDEGLVLTSVTEFKKQPVEEVEVNIYYQWRSPWLKVLGFKDFVRKKKETVYSLSCELEIGGKVLKIAVDEKKFCQFGRKKGRNTWFFTIKEDYLLRPTGIEGLKSIWEYILIEFKKVLPQLGLPTPRRV